MTASRVKNCAVAALFALIAGACGASDELSGAKGGYVAQVDPICTELQAKIGELGENAEQQAADVEAAVMRIKSVSMPNDDSVIADRFIASMENLYLSLQDVHQSRLVNDEPRAQRALETARINNKNAADAAEEYGMVVCAEEL